ncbi:MAG: N-acetylmuramoyl-L-alanine amidase [Acidobacteria bacterium]|nr:MAG: N-acetylmuramoyl-L-alanine amidase [Acidobacteriota bacterium]
MTWLEALLKLFAPQATAPTVALPGVTFHDRRRFAIQAHGPERQWKTTGRKWNRVTGITLHQTASLLGERPERWDTVGCHVGITRAGKVIHLHGFDRWVAHGNAWNDQCVGIEIDGLYAGIEGDESTVWDDPSTARRETGMTPTPEAIKAACDTVRWICAEVERHGGKVHALVAHRQSSMSRRNDPGSALWKAVALPMHAEIGLSDGGVGFKLGGSAIPEVWDERCKGIRY